MRRDDDGGRDATLVEAVEHDGAQGWPMQMVKMRVRHENQVNRRQVRDSKSGSAQPLENKQPPRKVWVDNDTLTADLHEEAGVSNEGDAQLAVGRETRLVSLTTTWGDGGVTHQSSELGSALTKGRIAKRLFNHRAAEPEDRNSELVLSYAFSLPKPSNLGDAADIFPSPDNVR